MGRLRARCGSSLRRAPVRIGTGLRLVPVRDPAAGDTRHRPVGLGVGRRAGDWRDRDHGRRRAGDGAGARDGHPGAAPPAARRASTGARCAQRCGARPSSTASRCGTARSTKCAPAPRRGRRRRCTDRRVRGRDRGWRVDAALGEQLGVDLPVGPAPRPDRAPGCRRARHRRVGRSCSRCTATTWCRGPTTASRSARRSRTSGFAPDVTAGGAATRSCARRCASCPGLASATLRRGAGRAPADERRRLADPRRAAGSRQRVRRDRPRRQRPAARPRQRPGDRRPGAAGKPPSVDLAPFSPAGVVQT